MKQLLLSITILLSLTSISLGQESQTLSGGAPLIFTSTGTGTYNKTVIYNTTSSGLLFDLARNADNISATPIDFNINARGGGHYFFTIKGSNGNVGIGTASPAFKLDVEGKGTRIKNSSIDLDAYTTFRIQGPNYEHGLEIDFFGNNNITDNINWSYGGGAGSASIVNVNAKPLTFGTNNTGRMIIDANGNVGIGTFNPGSYKLAVEGKIGAREINVTTAAWADYVFENTYKLRPLSQVESFIKENKHLPEVPSATEVKANGINLGEMDALLLKKIEELTLYMIELKKENEEIRKENILIKNELNKQKKS